VYRLGEAPDPIFEDDSDASANEANAQMDGRREASAFKYGYA